MSKAENQSPEVITDVLLAEAFPDLWEWERPTLNEAIGPNDLELVEAFEQDRRAFMATARQTLLDSPDDAISAELDENADNYGNQIAAIRKLLGHGLLQTLPRIPPPLAYGLGHPSFKPDFTYWAQMSELRLHEAVMVSVGVDPQVIDEGRVRKWEKEKAKAGVKSDLFSAIEFVLKRRELMHRAFPKWIHGPTPANTGQLYQWMRQIDLEIHPGFGAALDQRFAEKGQPEPTGSSKKDLSAQERSSLLKLVAAMACEQYGYDPSEERSEATSNIKNDLDLVGLSMDAKTIRKWLHEAAQQVDPSYWNTGS